MLKEDLPSFFFNFFLDESRSLFCCYDSYILGHISERVPLIRLTRGLKNNLDVKDISILMSLAMELFLKSSLFTIISVFHL